MNFDKDAFQEALNDSWEHHLANALDSVNRRSKERCPVSDEILELIHVAVAESYCAALKTIEDALTICFSSSASDTSPSES